jgi:hypothetical protein
MSEMSKMSKMYPCGCYETEDGDNTSFCDFHLKYMIELYSEKESLEKKLTELEEGIEEEREKLLKRIVIQNTQRSKM